MFDGRLDEQYLASILALGSVAAIQQLGGRFISCVLYLRRVNFERLVS